jgi:pimeloyl-ACP methyl ester carboxylesterase
MHPPNEDPPKLEAGPPAPLPPADARGRVAHDGVEIAYSTYGSGPPVVLLHGAFGNSEDWGNQVPALMVGGRRAVLIDSRGHGRSTRDARPFTYEGMATDVVAVMDHLNIDSAAVVGWSDGAIISLVLAMRSASRVTRVLAFAANMDLGGLKPVSPAHPLIAAAFKRAAQDYARLSDTPRDFPALSTAVGKMMKTQPNYSADDLAIISARVAIVAAEHDELIKREHAEYLSRSIAGARLIVLPGVSHFAPLQEPAMFNEVMLGFLEGP